MAGKKSNFKSIETKINLTGVLDLSDAESGNVLIDTEKGLDNVIDKIKEFDGDLVEIVIKNIVEKEIIGEDD